MVPPGVSPAWPVPGLSVVVLVQPSSRLHNSWAPNYARYSPHTTHRAVLRARCLAAPRRPLPVWHLDSVPECSLGRQPLSLMTEWPALSVAFCATSATLLGKRGTEPHRATQI